MGNRAGARRDDLRRRLLDAAEAEIVTKGLGNLKARDMTAAAGCSLGALYTAFESLDALILHLSARTLARLDNELRERVPDDPAPDARLTALAQAYVDFAMRHPRLWAALFDHSPPEGAVPDWHRAAQDRLIGRIAEPLAALRPDLGAEALSLRARTLFSAVHGVVHLSLTERFVGTPREALSSEVAALVEALTRGLPPTAA